LEGNNFVDSGMSIQFAQNTAGTLCSKTLTQDDVEMFKYAVSQHYWYQCFLDELPIWGMVGEIEGSEEELLEMELRGEQEHAIHEVFVYTMKRLSIAYNGNRIIEVNLTSDHPISAKEGAKLDFTYEVNWISTDKTFEERFNRYLDYSFFEHQIHWFSIFNAFMMVIFLCGLVALILVRALNNDYARYTRGSGGGIGGGIGGDDDEAGLSIEGAGSALGDESGWKQVHGDVFRTPEHLSVLAAAVGSGMQMVALSFITVLLSIAGSLYVDRGALITAVLLVYAFTGLVAGYVSGSLFQKYETNAAVKSKGWMRTMLLTAILFPGCVLIVYGTLNGISLWYSSLSVVPISTFLAIVAIYVLVLCPLVIIGTLLGRHATGEVSDFPCRVNSLPRPIPERTLFTHPLSIICLTGVLPFGAVFIEIFFIFSSVWAHRFYYVYGFLLLVLLILIVVSICVTIVAVYFQLNSEDWRWPWTSFLASASTAGYVFLYGIYFFVAKTNMSGFLQTNFYFGYLFLLTLALGLMCGSLGFLGAFTFVKTVFSRIKSD
jgi:transmembrane 9 superfamily protein 3